MDKTNIKIKQIISEDNRPSLIEFFSAFDSRSHITSIENFMTIFGYTVTDINDEVSAIDAAA